MNAKSKASGQKPWQMTPPKHEKPRPSQAPWARPLPPGIVSSPSASSTGSYQQPVPSEPMPPKEHNWKRTQKGKRDYIRVKEHHKEVQHEKFWKMDEDPTPDAPKMHWYPSDTFLWKSESHLLARYANFLLQSLMILVRVFEIPSVLITHHHPHESGW